MSKIQFYEISRKCSSYIGWRGMSLFKDEGVIMLKFPWENEHFPGLAQLFHVSIPKLWNTHPLKNYFSEQRKNIAIAQLSFTLTI